VKLLKVKRDNKKFVKISINSIPTPRGFQEYFAPHEQFKASTKLGHNQVL